MWLRALIHLQARNLSVFFAAKFAYGLISVRLVRKAEQTLRTHYNIGVNGALSCSLVLCMLQIQIRER